MNTQKLCTIYVCLVFLDSIFSYFLGLAGIPNIPLNVLWILICIASIILLNTNGKEDVFYFSKVSIVVIILLVSQFFLGFQNEITTIYFNQIITAIISFFIAYNCVDNRAYLDYVLKRISMCSLVYIFVSFNIVAGILPANYDSGFREGLEVIRPLLTTDQNYQIYYFIPALFAPLYLDKFRLPGFILVFLAICILEMYIQSRSGLLYAISAFMLVSYFSFDLDIKGCIVFVLMLVFIIAFFNFISINRITLFTDFILRVNESGFRTGLARLNSFLYLFESMTHLENYILPEGFSKYEKLNGGYPHNYLTAQFLIFGASSFLFFTYCTSIFFGIVRNYLTFNDRSQVYLIIIMMLFFLISQSLPSITFKLNWIVLGLAAGTNRVCQTEKLS